MSNSSSILRGKTVVQLAHDLGATVEYLIPHSN
jgi:hypothetical protein